MANSTIGAGVLSLPLVFQSTGLIGGALLCFVVGTTEALTLYVLSKFAERYAASTYVQLVRRALGRKLAALLSAMLIVAMFGACIAYMIILGDNLSSLAAAVRLPGWAADRHHIITALGALVMLPMCLPSQLGALAAVNRVAVLGFLAGAACVAYRGMQVALTSRPHLLEGVALFRADYSTLSVLPIIVFGFNCHSTVVSIFAEMEASPSVLVPVIPGSPSVFRRYRYAPRPGSRKLVGMLGVILASTGFVMAAYMVVGISGYLAYPGHVDSNILNSFPRDDLAMQIARAAVSLIILGSYPLTHHPARAGFEHLVSSLLPSSPSSDLPASATPFATSSPTAVPLFLRVGFTLLFVGGSTAAALVVTDLGAVLHLLGGLCISFIIFFLPGLLLINAAILKHASAVLEIADSMQDEELAGSRHGPLSAPLLQRLEGGRDKGIKKAGLLFAPRLSWAYGSALLALSAAVAGVTLLTAVWGRE